VVGKKINITSKAVPRVRAVSTLTVVMETSICILSSPSSFNRHHGIYRLYNIISHAAASVGVVTLCCVQLIPNRCIPPLRSVLPLPLQGRIMTLPRNLERRSCSSCPRQPLIFQTPPLSELVLSPYSHRSFNWFNIKDNDYVTLGFENDDMIFKKIDKSLRVLCSGSDEQPTVFHSKVKQASIALISSCFIINNRKKTTS